MRPALIKSKQDRYKVLEVSVQHLEYSTRFDMKLEHLGTFIVTEGHLIIEHRDLPGKLKRDVLDSKQEKHVSKKLEEALNKDTEVTLNINDFIEEIALEFSKEFGSKGSIQKDISINKSKHKNFIKNGEALRLAVLTDYTKIAQVNVNGNSHLVTITAIEAINEEYLKDFTNLIKKLFNWDTIETQIKLI